MLLAIAIIATIGFVVNVVWHILISREKYSVRPIFICLIMVLAWWNTSIAISILMFILSAVWIYLQYWGDKSMNEDNS